MGWGGHDIAGTIPERFEHIARRDPQAVAISGADGSLTYAELDALADAQARALPSRQITAPPRPSVCALLLDHGPDVIVGALSALKRGFTVIVLNPADPPARLAQLRAAVTPAVTLICQRHRAVAELAGVAPGELRVLGAAPEHGEATAPVDDDAQRPRPGEVAFLISTSGSTGTPKVVMQTHRNVLHNVLRYTNGLGIRSEDRVAWLAALSGGQGLATAWTALLNGATLCPFPIAERGVAGLAGWLAEHEVSVLDTIPSVLRNFALTLRDERITGVRLVRLASEAGLRSDFEAFQRHFSEQCSLASVLASSEAGIMAHTILAAGFEPGERLPVGTAAEGVTLLLVGEDGAEVAAGEPGEIVVAGRYLSPGYWRDAALTAERFEGEGADRRFHTGDIAVRAADGGLTIVGRKDSQVKIHGHRLQLEEVEAALAAQPDVAAAAVLAAPAARGDMRLTAFVVTAGGAQRPTAGLRRALHEVLAPHAVPAAFVWVDALPTTSHGKVDRARLAERLVVPGAANGSPDAVRAARPRSEPEEVLATIWRQAFDRADIAFDAPFLELGGDSLTAAVIAAGVHDAFGVELGLAAFASDITIAKLVEIVAGGDGAAEDVLPPLRRRRPPPASFVQRFMWGVSQADPLGLVVATAYRITGPLDVPAFADAIEAIVHRHDALRTTFTEVDGAAVQHVGPCGPVELPLYDLRGDPDPDARARELLAMEGRRHFDLERGPLVRFVLVRCADADHRLLRVNHHLVADAVSWRIFCEELAVAYEQRLRGEELAPGEDLPVQYADFAIWEAACLRLTDRPRYQEEIAWWERQLEDPPPPPALPFFRDEDADGQTPSSHTIEWGLAPAHAAAIAAVAQQRGATYYMTRLALFSALLAIETDMPDLLIETYMTTRRRPELQPMIGLFINRALLRLRFTGAPSFGQWLDEVRRVVIDTSVNAAIPHTRLRHELRRRGHDLPYTPTKFQALYQVPPMRFGGLELTRLPRDQQAPQGFILGVDPSYDADGCRAAFDPRVYDPGRVVAFLERLRGLAAAVSADPGAPLPALCAAGVA